MVDQKRDVDEEFVDDKVEEQVDNKEQEMQKGEEAPASDLYEEVSHKDPETGVEVPTDAAVEKAREWSEENQR